MVGPDAEAVEERPEQSGPFVGELHGQHARGGQGAEDQPGDQAMNEGCHDSELICARPTGQTLSRVRRIRGPGHGLRDWI